MPYHLAKSAEESVCTHVLTTGVEPVIVCSFVLQNTVLNRIASRV